MSNPTPQAETQVAAMPVQAISVQPPLPPTLVAIIQNVSLVFAVIRDFIFLVYAVLRGNISFVDIRAQLRIAAAAGEARVNDHEDTRALAEEKPKGVVTEPSADSGVPVTKQTVETTEETSQPWKGSAVRELCRSMVSKDIDHVIEYAHPPLPPTDELL
jgi:hypothetical protein